jgi:drug/metabolite transporter (DMT)-like permease
MAGGRGTVLLIMLFSVLALVAGETALAKGLKQIDRLQGGWVEQASGFLRNGWIWAGLALMVTHLALYMLALKTADLSYVLPLTAASYPLAALFARVFLHEDVGFSRIMGTLLITAGVAIVVLGEPGGPLSRREPAQTAPSPEPAGPLETG